MVKSIQFFKRKAELSVGDFQRYWLNDHAAVIRKVPELRCYVASCTLASGYRKHEPIYDGVSEAWFDDEDAIRANANSAPRRAASEDDRKFIDMAVYDSLIVDEVVQKDGKLPAGAVKMFAFLTRKPGTEVAAYQSYWRKIHGPLAAKVPQSIRYIQCHPRSIAYADGKRPRYDGVAETWFASVDAMRESGLSPEYAAVRADEPNFLAPTRIPFIIAEEHVIV